MTEVSCDFSQYKKDGKRLKSGCDCKTFGILFISGKLKLRGVLQMETLAACFVDSQLDSTSYGVVWFGCVCLHVTSLVPRQSPSRARHSCTYTVPIDRWCLRYTYCIYRLYGQLRKPCLSQGSQGSSHPIILIEGFLCSLLQQSLQQAYYVSGLTTTLTSSVNSSAKLMGRRKYGENIPTR